MFLSEFPNLKWIQHQSKTNFENRVGEGDLQLKESGWPSVVLNVTTEKTERNNIKAPLSLFTNFSGKSMVRADGKEIVVGPDAFCLVNKGDIYDLSIIEDDTETFNIHFGDQLYTQTSHLVTSSHQDLLDNIQPSDPKNHLTCSHWRDDRVDQYLKRMKRFYENPNKAEDEELLLSELLTLMLVKSGERSLGLEKIGAQKASTKKELLSRVSLARDYIHDCFKQRVSIDELASIAMMSKFHFLRVFKEAFGCTPHQYLMNIRLEKAEKLLKSDMTVEQVAFSIGFEEVNSFYQFYKKRRSATPSQNRRAISNFE